MFSETPTGGHPFLNPTDWRKSTPFCVCTYHWFVDWLTAVLNRLQIGEGTKQKANNAKRLINLSKWLSGQGIKCPWVLRSAPVDQEPSQELKDS